MTLDFNVDIALNNDNIIFIIYRLARRYYLRLSKSNNNSRPAKFCQILKLANEKKCIPNMCCSLRLLFLYVII